MIDINYILMYNCKYIICKKGLNMKYTYSAGRIQINASGKQGNMNKFLYAGTKKKNKKRK